MVDKDGRDSNGIRGCCPNRQAGSSNSKADPLSESAYEHKLLTSPLINNKHDHTTPDHQRHEVACREDQGPSTSEAKRSGKNDRHVIDNDVDTAHLLHERGSGTQGDSAEGLLLPVCEDLAPADLRQLSLVGDDGDDQLEGLDDGFVVDRLRQKTSNDRLGFGVSVLETEPSGRLRHASKKDDGENGEEGLEGNRESPADIAVWDVGETEIHPVGDDDAEDDEHELQGDELAAMLGLARLTLPDRHGGRVHADAQACDDSANDHLCERVRGGLDGAADDDKDTAQSNGLASAQDVADEDGHEGSKDATNVVG